MESKKVKTNKYVSLNGAVFEALSGTTADLKYAESYQKLKEEKVELTQQEIQRAMNDAGATYCAGTILWKKIFFKELGFN